MPWPDGVADQQHCSVPSPVYWWASDGGEFGDQQPVGTAEEQSLELMVIVWEFLQVKDEAMKRMKARARIRQLGCCF